MKLVEEYKNMNKEGVYWTYARIVYNMKDYEAISKKKMLEEIEKQYTDNKHFLFNMCTERELKFLKYALKNRVTYKDYKKYEWEINTLNDKCIFGKMGLDIIDELKDAVKDAVKEYDEEGKSSLEDTIIFMIVRVKETGELASLALYSLLDNIRKLSMKDFDAIMGCPLFHFYCCASYKYIESLKKDEEFLYYRDYLDMMDDLEEAKKIYGIGGTRELDTRNDPDMFYYGLPIKKKKVKEMYDKVIEMPNHFEIFTVIDIVRVLYDREIIESFIEDDDLKVLINEALDETPCAAMNAFTPNEFFKKIEENVDIQKEFTCERQTNAHLNKKDADEYYKLYMSLLEYTNKKYNVNNKIKKIYKQIGLNPQELKVIDSYLWKHRNVIDEYVKDNLYKLSDSELEEIKKFKNAVKEEFLIIVGYEKEYTEILSPKEGKLYMVKGLNANLDEIVGSKPPTIIDTALIEFRGNIVFNSFFGSYDIDLGSDFSKAVLEEMKGTIKYYHL